MFAHNQCRKLEAGNENGSGDTGVDCPRQRSGARAPDACRCGRGILEGPQEIREKRRGAHKEA